MPPLSDAEKIAILTQEVLLLTRSAEIVAEDRLQMQETCRTMITRLQADNKMLREEVRYFKAKFQSRAVGDTKRAQKMLLDRIRRQMNNFIMTHDTRKES